MLDVYDVNYAVKGKTILKDISFHLQKGSFMAVLGSNGAGKSSLLKCLTGDTTVGRGEIIIEKKHINHWDANALAKKRAYMGQHNDTSIDFSVMDIVAMGRYPYQKGRQNLENTKEIIKAIKQRGLWDLKDRPYASLSGGEQQRTQLARVLAQIGSQHKESKLLLMDEPVNHLDMYHQHQMMHQAREMANQGHTVLCVLHDINMAAMYVDRILMLKNGEIYCEGTPEAIINEEMVRKAYGYESIVTKHPIYQCPLVLVNQETNKHTKNIYVA